MQQVILKLLIINVSRVVQDQNVGRRDFTQNMLSGINSVNVFNNYENKCNWGIFMSKQMSVEISF